MKTRIIITGLFVALLSSASIIANAQDEPAVKILPTTQKGVLKVLYAYPVEQAVDIKFYSDGELLASDRIKGKNFAHGFSKKYDMRNVTSNGLWVEVSGSNITVTYKLVESADGKTFEPQLEKTTYHHALVAAR